MSDDVEPVKILSSVVWQLAKSGCDADEIAAFYQISRAEFDEIVEKTPRLAGLIADAKLAGKAEIRAAIHERALKGDTKLLQHRAQHELGQSATTKHEITGKDGSPLEMILRTIDGKTAGLPKDT